MWLADGDTASLRRGKAKDSRQIQCRTSEGT